MSNIKIDPEFQALIPPLAPQERNQLEENRLGFIGERFTGTGTDVDLEVVHIIPTPMGISYWLYSHASSNTLAKTFSKKPTATSRLPLHQWQGFDFKTVGCAPQWNYPTEQPTTSKKRSDVIYIIEAVGTDCVKIGIATGSPQERLKQLQTGCPNELVLRAEMPGCQSDESALHRIFARQHVRGEWFHLDGEINDFIESQSEKTSAMTADKTGVEE